MARVFKVNQFAARKRALAAESQAYRETLRLEMQNLRLYGRRVRQRVNSLTSSPVVRLASLAGSALAASTLSRLFGRAPARKPVGRWRRLAFTAVTLFRLLREYGPLLAVLLPRTKSSPKAGAAGPTGPLADGETTP